MTYPLWHTFSNDGNGSNVGESHELHGGAVDTAGGSEVDNGVDLGVLGHGFVYRIVDWQ